MKISFTHIALFSNNPKKLISFYIKKFGLKKVKAGFAQKKIIRQIFGFSSDCNLVKLAKDNVCVEIISKASGRFKRLDTNRAGYSHWAIGVKDKKSYCKMLSKRGIKVRKLKRNGSLVLFIKDSDGNLMEIQDA